MAFSYASQYELHRTFSAATSEATPASTVSGQYEPSAGTPKVAVALNEYAQGGTVTASEIRIWAISGSNVIYVTKLDLGTATPGRVVEATFVPAPGAKYYASLYQTGTTPTFTGKVYFRKLDA